LNPPTLGGEIQRNYSSADRKSAERKAQSFPLRTFVCPLHLDEILHPEHENHCAAHRHLDGLRAALASAGEQPGELDDPESNRVTVVPATLAKGLEYDHVIVVEPADIVDAEPRGLHRLYVVLTRAVTRLTVLHARALPEALIVAGQG